MSNLGTRLVDKTKDIARLSSELKQANKDIKGLQDTIGALTNENDELSAKLNKWIKLQENGYVACWVNEATGLLEYATEIRPFSMFIHSQPIPIELGTALYSKIPFYELDSNGTIIENTLQKIKYKGVL